MKAHINLRLLVRVFSLILLHSIAASVARAGEPAWFIALHPGSSALTNWDRFSAGIHAARSSPVSEQSQIRSWEFAVRAETGIGARLKFQGMQPLRGVVSNWSRFSGGVYWFNLGHGQIKRLNDLGEGTFECALLGDGVRYSNVARVRVDHSYRADTEPMIRVVAIQPATGDHVTDVGVWIVPPAKPDDRITTIWAHAKSTLVIDGVSLWKSMRTSYSFGKPMEPGQSYGFTFHLPDYKPELPVKTSYDIQLKLYDYESAVTKISYDPEIGARFDRFFKDLAQ